MSGRTDNIISLLQPFGLNEDEACVYLDLLENGVETALKISRNTRLGRTKVYRILDKLIEQQLVKQQYQDAGFTFLAEEPQQLEMLLAKKEGEVSALRYLLPNVINTLQKHSGGGKPGSQVLYYHGKSGLTQVNFNVLKAKGEFMSYEVATADAYLDHNDAEELRKELVANKILTRTITNQTHIKPFTKVAEMVAKWWQIKYVDEKILKIQADIFIYNDVYAMCHYLEGKDIFCLEMHNEYLTKMQKEMFEVMWEVAEPMKIIGDNGEARLL